MERQVRLLLAWLEENEAVGHLLGHMPAPNEEAREQRETWQAARITLQARPPHSSPAPSPGELPPELREQGDAFRQRADVLASLQPHNWSLQMVNLREVLSFQKLVVEEQATERANAVATNDLQGLFEFCLPAFSGAEKLAGLPDPDRRGITFTSLNPNLRVGKHLVLDIDVPAGIGVPGRREKFIGYSINFGSQFIQVAEYNRRCFVRDGYHRTYGLLRRGIDCVPCIFIKARSFEELGAAAAGFFSYETLFGERPPFLRDFLDDGVSISAKQPALRKAVRISAEEFVIGI